MDRFRSVFSIARKSISPWCFPVSDITIRGKFSRGKRRAHNSIAICAFERLRIRWHSYPRTFISMCAQKRVPIYFSRDGDKEAKRRIEERQRDTEERKWKARGERYTMYIRNRGYDSTLVYFFCPLLSFQFPLSVSLAPLLSLRSSWWPMIRRWDKNRFNEISSDSFRWRGNRETMKIWKRGNGVGTYPSLDESCLFHTRLVFSLLKFNVCARETFPSHLHL